MKAVEFIKKHGWEEAKFYLSTALNDAIYMEFNMPKYGIEKISLNVSELKRLVEIWRLIQSKGGLENAKEDELWANELGFGYKGLAQAIADVESVELP